VPYRFDDPVDGLVRPPLGSKPIGARMKIRFPDGHQDQDHRGLHHAVFYRWDAQPTLAASRFLN